MSFNKCPCKNLTSLETRHKNSVVIFVCVLGGSVCVNTPIFFSKNHGLISVSSNDLMPDLNMSQTITNQIDNSFNETAANNLTVYNLDGDDVFNAHKDTLGQFKAAFIFHVKRQQVRVFHKNNFFS